MNRLYDFILQYMIRYIVYKAAPNYQIILIILHRCQRQWIIRSGGVGVSKAGAGRQEIQRQGRQGQAGRARPKWPPLPRALTARIWYFQKVFKKCRAQRRHFLKIYIIFLLNSLSKMPRAARNFFHRCMYIVYIHIYIYIHTRGRAQRGNFF